MARRYPLVFGLCLAAGLGVCGPTNAQVAPAYRLTDLGPITITGGGAFDINNVGQVALNLNGTGYVWENGRLSPPGGLFNNNTTFPINSSGNVAWTQDLKAVYWNGQTTTTLPQLEGGITSANGLNDANVVVGNSYRDSILQYRGFLWDGTTIVDLGSTTPAGGSTATAINNAGVVAGSANSLPARWQAGSWTTLPLLAGDAYGGATAINQAGTIVGWSAPPSDYNAMRPVEWVNCQALALGTVDGRQFGRAFGINDQGDVVGSVDQYSGDDEPFAFIYSGGQMFDLTSRLTTPGYWVQQANAINDAGQIVALAQFSGDNFDLHAVLLTPVPEPSSLALLAVAAVLVIRIKRRARQSDDAAGTKCCDRLLSIGQPRSRRIMQATRLDLPCRRLCGFCTAHQA